MTAGGALMMRLRMGAHLLPWSLNRNFPGCTKLGPNLLPVLRKKVLASDGAAEGLFDFYGQLWRTRPLTPGNCAQEHRGGAGRTRQLSSVASSRIEVGSKFVHPRSIAMLSVERLAMLSSSIDSIACYGR